MKLQVEGFVEFFQGDKNLITVRFLRSSVLRHLGFQGVPKQYLGNQNGWFEFPSMTKCSPHLNLTLNRLNNTLKKTGAKGFSEEIST